MDGTPVATLGFLFYMSIKGLFLRPNHDGTSDRLGYLAVQCRLAARGSLTNLCGLGKLYYYLNLPLPTIDFHD